MSRDSVTGAAVLELTINSCLYIKKQFGSKVFFLMISRYHFNVSLPRKHVYAKEEDNSSRLSLFRGFDLST